MRVASFFAGIGGIDLGLERLGMQTVFQCEWDPYCQKVLAKHWPEVKRHGDIRTLTADAIPDADVWAGGFPCQPFSVAGNRKASQDERHLWPVWFDLIRQARPRYLLLENVPGLLSAEDGRVFGDLLRDLASVGYDAEWHSVSAAAVGAPHLRWRVFVIAYPDSQRRQELHAPSKPGFEGFSCGLGDSDVADAYRERRSRYSQPDSQPEQPGQHALGWGNALRCGEIDRGHWTSQPRPIGVAHGVPNRVDRVRAMGNAVVPQDAELMGIRLLEIARSI